MQHLVHRVLHGLLSWPDWLVNIMWGVVKVSQSDARPRVCVFRLSGCPLGERYRRLREEEKPDLSKEWNTV